MPSTVVAVADDVAIRTLIISSVTINTAMRRQSGCKAGAR